MEQQKVVKPYSFVDDTLKELDAGIFADKLTAMVKDVALGAHEYDQKGEVVISLTMKRIKNTNQVMLTHTLRYKRPTMNGKAGEESTTATALYVGRGGKLTLLPDNQTGFEFNKD